SVTLGPAKCDASKADPERRTCLPERNCDRRPLPGKSWPGCSICQGLEPVRVMLPAPPFELPLSDSLDRVELVVEPEPAEHRLRAVSLEVPARPIFIAHCALLL